jgi:hypothetical protein
MHACTVAAGNAAWMASSNPVSPSQQAMRMSGDAAVAQVGRHRAPEAGALPGGRGMAVGPGQPDAQHVLVAVGVDAGRQVGGLVRHDVVVADLDHDRVQEHHGIDRVQGPGLPGPHFLHHRLGDPRDGLGGQDGPVDLLEVVDDVPGAHAVRVQADDHVIQAAGDPPGPLGHQHRLEAAGPVAGHRDADRPDTGLHGLGDGPVPGVPRVMPGPLMRLVPRVRGHLGLQRPLQHRPHQLPGHRPLAGQPQLPGLVLRPGQQLVQRPVADQLPDRHHPAGTRLLRPPAVTVPQSRKTGISPVDRHDD